MLEMSSAWINARTDTPDHGMSHHSKVPGRLWMVWKAQKCIGEVAVHFQLNLNTLGVLNVLTVKHLRLEFNTFLGRAQKSNVGRHTLIWTISLVVVSGNRVSWSSVLDAPCIPLRNVVYSLYYEVNFIWFVMLKFKIFNYITFVVSFMPNRHIFAAIYCVHILPFTLHSRTL